jgi:hypothetical protein
MFYTDCSSEVTVHLKHTQQCEVGSINWTLNALHTAGRCRGLYLQGTTQYINTRDKYLCPQRVATGIDTVIYCPKKTTVTKMRSSRYSFLQLLEPILFYAASVSTAFYIEHFLSNTSINAPFFTNFKIVYEAGTRKPGYLRTNLRLHDL